LKEATVARTAPVQSFFPSSYLFVESPIVASTVHTKQNSKARRILLPY
jgi:hypothetical protein